tara:strand:- start:768 stop:1373 length:606 start_codon:yes stop_codon:yes gene_type:complete
MDNKQALYKVGDNVTITHGEFHGQQAKVAALQLVPQLGWQYGLEGLQGYQGKMYTLFEQQIASQTGNMQQQQLSPIKTGYSDVASALQQAAENIQQVDTNVVSLFQQVLDEMKAMRQTLDQHVATKELKITVDRPVSYNNISSGVEDIRMEEIRTAEVHNRVNVLDLSSNNGDQAQTEIEFESSSEPVAKDVDQEVDDGIS